MKISELIPASEAIPIAIYIRENDVKFKRLPGYYGGCFCQVEITDDRFESEVLFVGYRLLYSRF